MHSRMYPTQVFPHWNGLQNFLLTICVISSFLLEPLSQRLSIQTTASENVFWRRICVLFKRNFCAYGMLMIGFQETVIRLCGCGKLSYERTFLYKDFFTLFISIRFERIGIMKKISHCANNFQVVRTPTLPFSFAPLGFLKTTFLILYTRERGGGSKINLRSCSLPHWFREPIWICEFVMDYQYCGWYCISHTVADELLQMCSFWNRWYLQTTSSYLPITSHFQTIIKSDFKPICKFKVAYKCEVICKYEIICKYQWFW